MATTATEYKLFESDIRILRAMAADWKKNGGSLVSQSFAQRVLPVQPILARLVNAGPNGESDYTDHRYWFRAVRDESTSTSRTELPTIKYIPADHPYAIHATATNLADMDNATHSLAVASATAEPAEADKKNTIVLVWPIWNLAADEPTRRYVFFGGQPPVPDMTKDHIEVYDSTTQKIKWISSTEDCPGTGS